VVFNRATLASMAISCRRVSFRLSVTNRCSTETAKHSIAQTTPHDSTETLVFLCQKYQQNTNEVTPNVGAKYKSGRLDAGAAAAD